jgi:hypothetical protein
MDGNDRKAIEDLFVKLGEVEGRSPPRDREAESFIARQIAGQPGAPYYMAQTIVVQEQALAAAQARIEELEGAQAEEARGGFRMPFGRERDQPAERGARRGSVPSIGRATPEAGGAGFGRGGGGFLAGAAQTAMGVAGGLLLGNAIAGMFGGGGEAQAAESAPADEAAVDEPGIDEAPADDGGFDMGGMDDFEF